mmetsp:Transcript_2313/g.5377  ORF Transcript_2313/g.5377 Transcript_2313/m.5377 type:complete len:80 (-) Transcript_2313:497-736(-)
MLCFMHLRQIMNEIWEQFQEGDKSLAPSTISYCLPTHCCMGQKRGGTKAEGVQLRAMWNRHKAHPQLSIRPNQKSYHGK